MGKHDRRHGLMRPLVSERLLDLAEGRIPAGGPAVGMALPMAIRSARHAPAQIDGDRRVAPIVPHLHPAFEGRPAAAMDEDHRRELRAGRRGRGSVPREHASRSPLVFRPGKEERPDPLIPLGADLEAVGRVHLRRARQPLEIERRHAEALRRLRLTFGGARGRRQRSRQEQGGEENDPQARQRPRQQARHGGDSRRRVVASRGVGGGPGAGDHGTALRGEL